MNKNSEKSSKNDSSSLFNLFTFSVIIAIILTTLILTPFGNILSEELANSEIIDAIPNNETTKNDSIGSTENDNKKIIFTYTAKYDHLGTENDILLDGTVFFSFPMPMIENNATVNLGPNNHKIENSTVQLLASFKENGKKITRIQIENGNYGKFYEPRQNAIFSEKPFVSNLENHGKKITVQSSGGGFTKAFRKTGSGGAIYKHEEILIETKFSVAKEKIDELTLKDKKDKISSQVLGTTDGPNTDHTHIPIKYSVTVSLSRKTSDGQTVEKYRFKAEEPIPKNRTVELKEVS